MKRIVTAFIFLLAISFTGCSSDDPSDTTPVTPEEPAAPVNELSIDGVQVIGQQTTRSFIVYKRADEISVSVASGPVGYQYGLELTFSEDGAFIRGRMAYSYYNYDSYINFPSNYLKVSDFSLDKENKKVEIKFSGKIFEDKLDPFSESRTIEGHITQVYEDYGDEDTVPYHQLFFDDIPQYCLAKLNGKPWKARFERLMSVFTSTDAYKMEVVLANNPNPMNYTFDANNTANYVKLSKFNPLTLAYDYYNIAGQVATSYREYHGSNTYSFIGTFSFTATNPANPQDVIQVTDGEFWAIQHY